MRPIAARYDRAANRVTTPASVTMSTAVTTSTAWPTECRRQMMAEAPRRPVRLSAAGSSAGSEVT